MTTRTLTALYDRYDQAAEAVRALEAAGVAHDNISIVSNDAAHDQYRDTAAGDHISGTGTGASLGTLLGGGAGLLAGLGMLAIPGLGPVVAAGWLASTLVGAGIGAAAGGVVGSLTDVGVSEEDAHAYAEGIRRGGTLVTVRADDTMTSRVSEILDRDGTVDMADRESSWRNEGWDGRYSDVTTASPGYADADRGYAGSTAGTGAGYGGTMGATGLGGTTTTDAGLGTSGTGLGGAGLGTSGTGLGGTGLGTTATGMTGAGRTGSAVGDAAAGIGAAASRVGEKIEDGARRLGDAVTGSGTTRPASDYAAGSPSTGADYVARPGDTVRTGRGRVRVYDQP